MKRILAAPALLGLVLAFGPGALPAASQTLDTVTVGTVDSVADAAFLIADRKGYFRDAGITVRFVPFDSGALMIAPLGTGELDAAGGAPGPGLYNAIARGIKIKIVADRGRPAPGYGFVPLLIRKELVASGKYKTVADLRGLRVAEPARGSTTLPEIERLLAPVHLSYADVQHVFLGFPDQVVALRGGAIDAALTLEPFATLAVRDGVAVRIAGNDTWYPNQENTVMLYAQSFIEKRPDVARRFMVAVLRAVRYYNDALKDGRLAGPTASDVVTILSEALKVDPGVLRAMTPSAVDPDGHLNLASLNYDYGVYKKYGLLAADVSIDSVIDMRFAEAAVKVLGPYRPRR